ncbi:KIF6 [Branchiostoma lanceolatum]|uniref:KIF6 protein n=1 Tax=Branchiostoma lanceolatum TaxID=7740 RepID=A0A8J9ZNY6_BRALA|nr:KIF6 [Branchiostoma lanceolatum]
MANIRTFCRVRPTDRISECVESSSKTVDVQVPNTSMFADSGVRGGLSHSFKFDQVFDGQVSQEEVFDSMARDIVEGFLAGYNGTIFAYGQTGSGKTYTVEGGARRYADRGLAPRALSMIYKALEERQQEEISVKVSYLEIYQEVGYDLLNTAGKTGVVPQLSKVSVVEGGKGYYVVRNLSTHLASTERVAQSLLLQGQANRKVAETPMNRRSSRSHAVFTIQLQAKEIGSEVITRSKLHLVDLAGSERVSKSGTRGARLEEAKFINLSLHHLEQVIVALQQGARRAGKDNSGMSRNASSFSLVSLAMSTFSTMSTGNRERHIPYRNSLLTMVLRDSLGGNCLTAMVANISVEHQNLGETLSTCRFAQRVACITNHASRNEELDDKMVIKRLKRRVAELEAEVRCLKAGLPPGQKADKDSPQSDPLQPIQLSEAEKKKCALIMQAFLVGKVNDPVTAGVNSPYMFRECLRVLRELVLKGMGRWVSETSLESSSRPISQQTMLTASSGFDETPVKTKPSSYRLFEGSAKRSASKSRTRSAPTPQHKSDMPTDKPKSGTSREVATPASTTRLSVQSEPVSPRRKEQLYKTPFEKKREKQIRTISKKLEKSQEEHLEQKKHLEEFQLDIRCQQLELVRGELESKIFLTKEQLARQHAYVLQLKHIQTDDETLSQEKLVQHQLQKTLNKAERRLELVQQHLADMEAKEQSQNVLSPPTDSVSKASSAKSYRSFLSEPSNVGQNGPPLLLSGEVHSTKSSEGLAVPVPVRGGAVSSRQVLEQLKIEQKKQQKEEKKIHKERVLTISKQLELKEAATRQKLQALKQMLKGSGPGRSPVNAWGGSGVQPNIVAGTSPVSEADHSQSPGKDINISVYVPYSVQTSDVPRRPNSLYTIEDNESTRSTANTGSLKEGDLAGKTFMTQSYDDDGFRDVGDNHRDLRSSATNQSLTSPRDLNSTYEFSKDDSGNIPAWKPHSLGYGNSQGAFLPVKPRQQGELFETPTSRPAKELSNSAAKPSGRDTRKPSKTYSSEEGRNHSASVGSSSHSQHGEYSALSFDPGQFSLSSKTFDSALQEMLQQGDPITANNLISKGSVYNKKPKSGISSVISVTSSESLGLSRESTMYDDADSTQYRKDSRPITAESHGTWYSGTPGKGSAVSSAKNEGRERQATQALFEGKLSRYLGGSQHEDRDDGYDGAFPLDGPLDQSTTAGQPKEVLTQNTTTPEGPSQSSFLQFLNKSRSVSPSQRTSSKTHKDGGGTKAKVKTTVMIEENTPRRIQAEKEAERERTYMNTVKEQKERVERIRRARNAAETIQLAWRRHRSCLK